MILIRCQNSRQCVSFSLHYGTTIRDSERIMARYPTKNYSKEQRIISKGKKSWYKTQLWHLETPTKLGHQCQQCINTAMVASVLSGLSSQEMALCCCTHQQPLAVWNLFMKKRDTLDLSLKRTHSCPLHTSQHFMCPRAWNYGLTEPPCSLATSMTLFLCPSLQAGGTNSVEPRNLKPWVYELYSQLVSEPWLHWHSMSHTSTLLLASNSILEAPEPLLLMWTYALYSSSTGTTAISAADTFLHHSANASVTVCFPALWIPFPHALYGHTCHMLPIVGTSAKETHIYHSGTVASHKPEAGWARPWPCCH